LQTNLLGVFGWISCETLNGGLRLKCKKQFSENQMKISFTITFILLLTTFSLAQDETIRVETNLVTVNVSVTDRQGKYVRGLTKNDFIVLDGGQIQDIDTFSSEDAPVSFAIIYDMHPTTDEQIMSILAAMRSFATSLRPEDDLFVTVFNEKGSLTTEFVPTDEQVRKQVEGGSNSLYDSIFEASDRIARTRNNKRVMLVLTDGTDHSSHHSLKELRTHLRSINLPVYAITFGGDDTRKYGYSDIFRGGPTQTFGRFETKELDRGVLDEISKTSGGKSFETGIKHRVYLSALYSRVYDDIKRQYVIGFYPEAADGKYHKLKVSVSGEKEKKLSVSSRKGYQSPPRPRSGTAATLK
jgi:Ca-activated chloride channel family protein